MGTKLFKYRIRAALFYWLWLPGLVIGVGFALDIILGFERWQGKYFLTIAALLLFGAGGGLISRANSDLAKLGGGTPSPARPACRLVVSGSYTICRHPMHLGYILAALGVVVLCRSPAMLLISYPLFLGWQIYFLKREEIFLAKRFGTEFTVYKQKISFLLPFFPVEKTL